MFGHSQIVHFVTFLALLSPALAATVYRLDFRSPEEIQEADGFVARNPSGTGSVIDHVKAKLGDDDPWISTTSDESVAKGGATSPGEVWVYHISTNGIKLVDTQEAFDDADEEHPKPGEKEFSVKGKIDWDSIIKWDVYVRGKKTGEKTRDDFEDGESDSDDEEDDKKRSVPFVRSVKFRV